MQSRRRLLEELSGYVWDPKATEKGRQLTDRHAGYVIALASDIREDDAEQIVTALRMIRGVVGVEPVVADGITEQVARMRADRRWRDRLIDLIDLGPRIHDGPGGG